MGKEIYPHKSDTRVHLKKCHLPLFTPYRCICEAHVFFQKRLFQVDSLENNLNDLYIFMVYISFGRRSVLEVHDWWEKKYILINLTQESTWKSAICHFLPLTDVSARHMFFFKNDFFKWTHTKFSSTYFLTLTEIRTVLWKCVSPCHLKHIRNEKGFSSLFLPSFRRQVISLAPAHTGGDCLKSISTPSEDWEFVVAPV